MGYIAQLTIPKIKSDTNLKLYVYRSTNADDINTISKVANMQPILVIDQNIAEVHTVNGKECYIVNDTPDETIDGVSYNGPQLNVVPIKEYETEINLIMLNSYTPVNELILNPLELNHKEGIVFYYSVMYSIVFILPLLTMRMFAEERKNGTEQLLLTSPRSITEIVLGKYFAAISVIIITLIFSLIYYGILCFFKAPNLVPTLVMMLGFLLVAMAAIAIGMFISSLTENQIIAAVITIIFFVGSWFLPSVNDSFSIIDLMSNYQKFPAGLISITEVFNLLGIAIMFVLFTIIIMQRKKSVK